MSVQARPARAYTVDSVCQQKQRSRGVLVVRAASPAAEGVAILDTLRQVRWNRRQAAPMLGVSYKTLLNTIVMKP